MQQQHYLIRTTQEFGGRRVKYADYHMLTHLSFEMKRGPRYQQFHCVLIIFATEHANSEYPELYLAQKIKHWKLERKKEIDMRVHENPPTAKKNMRRHNSLLGNEMSKPFPYQCEY